MNPSTDKRRRITLTDEAMAAVIALTTKANENFDVGKVTHSDAINEMIVCSRVDVKALQQKHTDLGRSLRAIAARTDLDLDSTIKLLKGMRARRAKASS